MIYMQVELKELVAYYGNPENGDLSPEEVGIIRGTLDLQLKTAGDIMTPVRIRLCNCIHMRTIVELHSACTGVCH